MRYLQTAVEHNVRLINNLLRSVILKTVKINSALSSIMASILLAFSVAAFACDKAYEGTYTLLNPEGKKVMGGVTVTLGEKTFALSSGASGTVESTGNKVIFSGGSFAGVFTVDGKNLKNEKWTLVKTE